MVRHRPDLSRHPREKHRRRRREKWLESLREEMMRRHWLVVTPFLPRLERAEVLWRRPHREREPSRPSGIQLRKYLKMIRERIRELLNVREVARRVRERARSIASIATNPKEAYMLLRRRIHEGLPTFKKELVKEFKKVMREEVLDSWAKRYALYIYHKIRFARAVYRLWQEVRHGDAIPVFEALVENVDGVKVWRVVSVDRRLMELSPVDRQRVIEALVALIMRGKPLYRDWLNPEMRLFLAKLVPELFPDYCHHKGVAVRATPVIVEEVKKRGVKHVYVFLRVVRVESVRADPLLGKGAVLQDPVLGEIIVRKPEEDTTSIMNTRKVATPFTSAHRRLVQYPDTLLAIHEAGVRRSLALASGVPEQDGVEGVDPCSLYLGPAHWASYDDMGDAERLLQSKPGRKRMGRALPGVEKPVPSQETLEELNFFEIAGLA